MLSHTGRRRQEGSAEHEAKVDGREGKCFFLPKWLWAEEGSTIGYLMVCAASGRKTMAVGEGNYKPECRMPHNVKYKGRLDG